MRVTKYASVNTQFLYFARGDVVEASVPAPTANVVCGVRWGRPDALFTPAYWLTQLWMVNATTPTVSHRIGATLAEEVAACMLGGHGIPAEIGLLAFERLQRSQLIARLCADEHEIAQILRTPFGIRGRSVTYRFWSQKARYLSAAFRLMASAAPPCQAALPLREYLLGIPGVGYKTASWIVRNWLNSDEVAVLDIHIIRAGQLMGLFTARDDVARHYVSMEARFLAVARAMNVSAADLDALIWRQMRESPKIVARALASIQSREDPSVDCGSPISAKPVATPRNGRSRTSLSRWGDPVAPRILKGRPSPAATTAACPRRTPASLCKSSDGET